MPDPTSEAGPDDDRADMAQLRADLPAALDRIIQRHGTAIHAYLLRLVHDAEDARDLTLETFFRIHAHRARFDPRRPFATWLYTIATNLARDRLRWRARHPEVPLPTFETSRTTSDPSTLQIAAADPSQDLMHAERAAAVRQAIARLPDDLRAALVLSEFENQSNAEIASVMGCSTKAVEMRLYRARHQLRNLLAQWILD